MYYSLLQGAAVFARKSMSSKNGTRTKGGIIAISPSGKEHLYPQAADAALDLGLYEERICDALGGKLQSVGGYRFRRYTLAK